MHRKAVKEKVGTWLYLSFDNFFHDVVERVCLLAFVDSLEPLVPMLVRLLHRQVQVVVRLLSRQVLKKTKKIASHRLKKYV